MVILAKILLKAEVIDFDPEIIFVSYCGFGTKSDPQHVLKRGTWSGVTAVKNNSVVALNETILNRPGPRILEAAQEISSYLRTSSS
jgi:iron complex transport system substrate-binding protein